MPLHVPGSCLVHDVVVTTPQRHLRPGPGPGNAAGLGYIRAANVGLGCCSVRRVQAVPLLRSIFSSSLCSSIGLLCFLSPSLSLSVASFFLSVSICPLPRPAPLQHPTHSFFPLNYRAGVLFWRRSCCVLGCRVYKSAAPPPPLLVTVKAAICPWLAATLCSHQILFMKLFLGAEVRTCPVSVLICASHQGDCRREWRRYLCNDSAAGVLNDD